MREYRVDEIKGNQYMGTEYHQIADDGHHVIFLCSNKVSLKVGDHVDIDKTGNVYKDGEMILDKEKERAERYAATEKRKKEILRGADE